MIRQSIDAPLWAADPAINGLAGGVTGIRSAAARPTTWGPTGDGALVEFPDNVLWAATNAIRTPIRHVLGAADPPVRITPQSSVQASWRRASAL